MNVCCEKGLFRFSHRDIKMQLRGWVTQTKKNSPKNILSFKAAKERYLLLQEWTVAYAHMLPETCVVSSVLCCVCVRLSSHLWVLTCRPPAAEEHFTELHQREKQRGRTKWERHQRPILPTVSTCCNIPMVTADKPLYKQPVQILPAGCSHSKAVCSLGFVYRSAAWTAGQHGRREGDGWG